MATPLARRQVLTATTTIMCRAEARLMIATTTMRRTQARLMIATQVDHNMNARDVRAIRLFGRGGRERGRNARKEPPRSM